MTCTALLPHPEQKTGEWQSVRHLRTCISLEIPTKCAQERDCNVVQIDPLSWPSGPSTRGEQLHQLQALLTASVSRRHGRVSPEERERNLGRSVTAIYSLYSVARQVVLLTSKPPRTYVISWLGDGLITAVTTPCVTWYRSSSWTAL